MNVSVLSFARRIPCVSPQTATQKGYFWKYIVRELQKLTLGCCASGGIGHGFLRSRDRSR